MNHLPDKKRPENEQHTPKPFLPADSRRRRRRRRLFRFLPTSMSGQSGRNQPRL